MIPQGIPQGYAERNSDLVGYWTQETPIHLVPGHVHLVDSHLNPSRSAALIIGTLVDRAKLMKGVDLVTGLEGETAGVWYRPGLRAICSLAGSKVYVVPDGEKVIPGKPSPMKTFKIYSDRPGTVLPVNGDYRKLSRGDTSLLSLFFLSDQPSSSTLISSTESDSLPF